MKIGRNDATLAHALAKGTAANQMYRDIARMRDGIEGYSNKRTMRAAFKKLRGVFKERVIYEQIEREKGSRARGFLFILEPLPTGDLVLFMMAWIKGKATQHDVPIIVSHHALARMMQRTVGESNLAACCERLKPYVMGATNEVTRDKLAKTKNMQLTIAGRGGVLIFRREDNFLIAKTWLDADMMVDRKLRARAVHPELTGMWEEVVDDNRERRPGEGAADGGRHTAYLQQ